MSHSRHTKATKRGLGVYAEDEIWHGQELLLANREYPMREEATAREKLPEITKDGTENEGVLGTDAIGDAPQAESNGH